MTTPKRIQRKRTKGWRMPEGAVYVGRPTAWGNPFMVGDYGREGAFSMFSQMTERTTGLRAGWVDFRLFTTYPSDDDIREALAGLDLACWCPLDQPCHADVLLKIANAHTHPERLRSLAHQEESA